MDAFREMPYPETATLGPPPTPLAAAMRIELFEELLRRRHRGSGSARTDSWPASSSATGAAPRRDRTAMPAPSATATRRSPSSSPRWPRTAPTGPRAPGGGRQGRRQAGAARDRRHVPQLPRRRGAHAVGLHAGGLPPAGGGQARVRPRQRVRRAPRHPAGGLGRGALVEIAAGAEVEVVRRGRLQVRLGDVAAVALDRVRGSPPRTPRPRAGRRGRRSRAGARASRRGAGRRRRRGRSA